jgi:hypothetical protein
MSDESKEQREQKYKKHHELLTATYGAFADLRKDLQAQAPTQNKNQTHTPQIYITPSRINPFTPRDTRISPELSLEELVNLQLKEIEHRMDHKWWNSSLPKILKSLEELPKDHKYRVAFEIARRRVVPRRIFLKLALLLILLVGIAFVCGIIFLIGFAIFKGINL